MDIEKVNILNTIKTLITVFIVIFVLYSTVSVYLYARIATDVRAFTQCESVDDEHFQACYDDKRK